MQAAAEKGFSDDTSILVVRADAQAKAGAAGTAAAAAAAGTAKYGCEDSARLRGDSLCGGKEQGNAARGRRRIFHE